MKKKMKTAELPVLDWSDLSESKFYEQLEKNMGAGEPLFCNTVPELLDKDLCTYIIYKDFGKGSISAAYSGRVEPIGIYPDHKSPLACVFYPMKKVDMEDVLYCKCCGRPDAIILKQKKL